MLPCGEAGACVVVVSWCGMVAHELCLPSLLYLLVVLCWRQVKAGMAYGVCFLLGFDLPSWLPARYWPTIKLLNLALCVPHIVRQSSLVLMSNTSHYYGDVPPGGDGMLYQNQVISMANILAWPAQVWWLRPVNDW